LNGNHGLDIFANGSPISRSVSCDNGVPIDGTKEATKNPGSKKWSYKRNKDQYSYVWKTSKYWSGSCREFLLNLDDGSEHAAIFRFKKSGKSKNSNNSKKPNKSDKSKESKKNGKF